MKFLFFLIFFTLNAHSSTWIFHLHSHMTQQLMDADGEEIKSDIYQTLGAGFFNSRSLFWRFNWEWGLNYSPRKIGVDDVTLEYKNLILPLGLRIPFGFHSISLGAYYSQSYGEVEHSEKGNSRLDELEYKNFGNGLYAGYSYRWMSSSILELRYMKGRGDYSTQRDTEVYFDEYQLIVGFFFGAGGSSSGESEDSDEEADVPDIDLGDLE
jgi:hypothetical protein